MEGTAADAEEADEAEDEADEAEEVVPPVEKLAVRLPVPYPQDEASLHALRTQAVNIHGNMDTMKGVINSRHYTSTSTSHPPPSPTTSTSPLPARGENSGEAVAG